MSVPSRLLDQSKVFFPASGQSLWGLDKRITKALAKMSLIRPTLIQAEVIPIALKGKDVLVRSCTGSGKTLAYLVPMLQKLLSRQAPPGIRAVILVPTRELCDQVEQQLRALCYYSTDAVSVVSLGSGSVDSRRARLGEMPDVVIATPGRLAEHLKEDGEMLRGCLETLVVDEADVKLIVARAPRTCQGFLMSATLEDSIKSLKSVVLNEPVVIKLQEGGQGEDATPNLSQWFVSLRKHDKDLIMFALLRLQLIAPGKALFFVNSVDRGYRLRLILEQFGVRAAVLNAELPANSRKHILEAFDKGLFDYLIATDEVMAKEEEQREEEEEEEAAAGQGQEEGAPAGPAPPSEFSAARGLDFRGVLTVVNVDMPADADTYIHRIGRCRRSSPTARTGARAPPDWRSTWPSWRGFGTGCKA
jgi:ATP-dependent RNA helicase DDX56/DBP9